MERNPASLAMASQRDLVGLAIRNGIKHIYPARFILALVCPLIFRNEVASAFLPTLRFPAPYETVEIPVEQMFTTFYWRFRTDNGSWQSGWTGWSKLTRTF